MVLGIAAGEPEHSSYVYLRIIYGVLSVGYICIARSSHAHILKGSI